jgi:hypothetical protein
LLGLPDGEIVTESLSDRRESSPEVTMTIRDLFLLNLKLQVFDGLFSLQALSLGAIEVNPIVAAVISNRRIAYGLAYKKSLACILLLLIFALRKRHGVMVMRPMIVSASLYLCVVVVCLWAASSLSRGRP